MACLVSAKKINWPQKKKHLERAGQEGKRKVFDKTGREEKTQGPE